MSPWSPLGGPWGPLGSPLDDLDPILGAVDCLGKLAVVNPDGI